MSSIVGMEEVFDVDGVEVEAVDVVVNESSRCPSKIERRQGWLVVVDDGCGSVIVWSGAGGSVIWRGDSGWGLALLGRRSRW